MHGHYAPLDYAFDVPDPTEAAIINHTRRKNRNAMRRLTERRRQQTPEEAWELVQRRLAEHGELNRAALIRSTRLNAGLLDAALAYGLDRQVAEFEERPGRADGSGRVGQFWRLRPPPDEQMSRYADWLAYERRNAPIGFDYNGRPYRRGQFIPGDVMFQHSAPIEYAGEPMSEDEKWRAFVDPQPIPERPWFDIPPADANPIPDFWNFGPRQDAQPAVPPAAPQPLDERAIAEHVANLNELMSYPDASFFDSYWNDLPAHHQDQIAQSLVPRNADPQPAAPAQQVAPSDDPQPVGALPNAASRQAEYETLRTAVPSAVRDLSVNQRGMNAIRLMEFEGPGGTWKGAFKPAQGEYDGLSSVVPSGGFYKREAAASRIADALGMGHLVPPTVIRQYEGGPGSLQKWVDGTASAYDLDASARYDGARDAANAAVLDYVLGNSDRHSGNWLLDGRNNFGLVLIDHGLSLPVTHMVDEWHHPWAASYTALMTNAARKELPIPLEQVSGKWPEIEAALREAGVEPEAIQLAAHRYHTLTSGHYRTVGDLPAWWLSNGAPLRQALAPTTV